MLCLGAERLLEGREWRYELKLDGFRAIGRKAARIAQLRSRNQKNFARRFPDVVKALIDCLTIPSLTVRSLPLMNPGGHHSTLQGLGT
jgi:ATP-dependent DNA ligase